MYVLSWKRVLPHSRRGVHRFETVFRLEVMPIFKNEPITMLLGIDEPLLLFKLKKLPLSEIPIESVHLLTRIGQNSFP